MKVGGADSEINNWMSGMMNVESEVPSRSEHQPARQLIYNDIMFEGQEWYPTRDSPGPGKSIPCDVESASPPRYICYEEIRMILAVT